MSYSPETTVVHGNNANDGTGLGNKLFNLKPSFTDIDDVYLSTNLNELDHNSSVSMVMSERVQRIASGIYKEFETMIEAYGLPVVERLMPLIISLLENLDELYKDQSAYHAEVRQLREENEHIFDQLTAEKAARKQSELRLLNTEDAFDEERKVNEAKHESLFTTCRQTELKLQLAKDQVSRLEFKENEWKKEENRLHERLNELIRSNIELTEQIKFMNSNSNNHTTTSSTTNSQQDHQHQSINLLNNNNNNIHKNKLTMNYALNKSNQIESKEYNNVSQTMNKLSVHSNSLDVGYDATSSGFGFDEMPSMLESESGVAGGGGLLTDDDLPDEYSITMNSELETNVFGSFSSFTSGQQRTDTSNEFIQNVEKDLSIHGTDTSLSWITLSATGTNSPIYGWATGKQSDRQFDDHNNNDDDNGCVIQNTNDTTNISENDKYIPVPIQCRTIGGLHRKHLEICTALTVPFISLDCNSEPKYHLWLIGRGGSIDSSNVNHSTSLNRGYLGQVHIFEPTKFIQPIYSFDLDNDFLPTTGVYVKNSEGATTCPSSPELTSDNEYIEFTWDLNESSCTSHVNETICNKNDDGYVILASNDGQFLVFRTCHIKKSTDSTNHPNNTDNNNNNNDEQITSSLYSVGLPQILYRFHTNNQCFVANAMISRDNYLCIGLFNSTGTSHFVCFQWPLSFMQNQLHPTALNTSSLTSTPTAGAAAVTPTTIQTKHKLINLPHKSSSTGPLIMATAFSSSNDQKLCLTTTTTTTTEENDVSCTSSDHIWLGTAGGGHCYCLNIQSGEFVTSIALPNKTPCLHAICVNSSKILWLAVSGNPTMCTINTNSDNNNNNNNNNNSNDLVQTNSLMTDSPKSMHEYVNNERTTSIGMARLLACCPRQKCILRQIDLTNALATMLDMENVTDPIDLTICRLLILPSTSDHELWFATRSGLIARLQLNYDKYKHPSMEIEFSGTSSITISCHGYRRPVCNLLLIHQNSNELIISVGHNYVDLRRLEEQIKQNNDSLLDQTSNLKSSIYRSRQMISGAHAIVWKLTNLRHV
ncbi:unnamed protein product [Schistosoma turkestanicum]|nr:unnamed protein product [Schistosoma turkestanicum]